MIVYAHRGLHGPGTPENTLAALRAAAAAGYGIETDLRTDAEGRLVLFHDRTLAGAPIAALTHAEIEQRAGYTVPTLDDLLALQLTVPLNLEVKTTAAMAALIPYLEAGLPGDILLSSFVHAVPVAAAARFGIASAYLLASASTLDAGWPVARERCRTIVWDFNIVDAALLAEAARRGFASFVYGPRTADEHRWLADAGVAAVISDTPALA